MMAATGQMRHAGSGKQATASVSVICTHSLQPVVHVDSGEPIYREMLVRFSDQRNVQEAILKAEQEREIQLIDLVTLAAAVEELRANDDSTPIAVNISPITIELCSDEIVATVAMIGAAASRLIFEITETAPILSLSSIEKFLDQLSAAGVRFALDDFGTGFCDIVRLTYLRVDFIKVPKAGPYGWATMLESHLQQLLQLAEAHSSVIIAEGVETEADVQAVSAMGIGGAQGYYFGRPRSIDGAGRNVGSGYAEKRALVAMG